MQARGRRIASNTLAFGLVLLFLTALVAWRINVMRRPDRSLPKVTIGTKDEIYYSHAATPDDARTLGRALHTLGYFTDRGSSVLLSKNRGGTVVSFVLSEGLWNSAPTVASFAEVGRRIAPSVGGLPLEIRLVDTAWNVHKSLQVGKIIMGSRDEVYYLGAATESDALSLGRALREAGYLQDRGVSVSLSKGDATALGFVVGEDVMRRPDVLARFASLARRVASSVGGMPIQVRLLSPQMEVTQEAEVR
ncbi:MAG TPA: hypothetical protein VKT49_19720 [Bryobacteraceae bacterium]|nr:hypothetical protein [Bryobacteraceae bacterium]